MERAELQRYLDTLLDVERLAIIAQTACRWKVGRRSRVRLRGDRSQALLDAAVARG